MNRTILLIGALGLVGCKGSKYDGVYRVFLEYKGATADGVAVEGLDKQTLEGMLSVYTTGPGTIAIGGTDNLLTGTRDGTGFKTEATFEYRTNNCTTDAYQELTEFEGDFTSDLGIEGDLVQMERQAQSGCEGGGEFSYENVIEYEITGIKLKGHNSRHPGGSSNWGYAPSTGGSGSGSGSGSGYDFK